MAITSSTISGNTASAGDGGAVRAYGTVLSVTDSTLSGNTASGNGGGVYLSSSASLSSMTSDWTAAGAGDNSPNDVYVSSQGAFDFGADATFMCNSGSGCT